MNAVFDTSALISLNTIDLLELGLENIEMITTSQVVEELEDMQGFEDRLAEEAESILSYIDEERLNVVEISEEKLDEVISRSVDKGEASCFICAKETKTKFLVMDDVEAASSLEAEAMREGIHQRISVAVIVELLQKGVISKRKVRKALDDLIEDRDWKGGVLELLAEEYFV
ncbi:MAG: hypothetical protein ACLFVB_03675, partial [Thermoplasmata archaeon]